MGMAPMLPLSSTRVLKHNTTLRLGLSLKRPQCSNDFLQD